jgi:excisionase family DNA binding protein
MTFVERRVVSDTPTANCEDYKADRLLNIREVAELMGLAPGTVYHLVSQQRIPVVRLSRRCIRFRLSDVNAWLDQKTDFPNQ